MLSSSACFFAYSVCELSKIAYYSPSSELTMREVLHLLNKVRRLKRAGNPLGSEGNLSLQTAVKFGFKILQFSWQIYWRQYQQHWYKKHWQSLRRHLTVAAETDWEPVAFCLFCPPHTQAHTLSSELLRQQIADKCAQWQACLDRLKSSLRVVSVYFSWSVQASIWYNLARIPTSWKYL